MNTLSALTQDLAQGDGWHHMDGWGGGWIWVWGSLMMLSWVVIIAAAVWFLGRQRDRDRPSRARDTLDERYASGELSSEEYRERREHLR